MNEDVSVAKPNTTAYYQKQEENHWKSLQALIHNQNLTLSDILINFPAFIRRRDLPRLLADYELFKQIMHMPGSIIELGVYLGAGLFTWSKLLETFLPGDRSRKVYGFDSGRGYEKLSPEDGSPEPWIKNVTGQKKANTEFVQAMVALHNQDNLIPGVERCRLIPGDIRETVPEFVKKSQGIRLSLLYFDLNLYEPTLIGLRYLYPLVMPGGIIAFNGYGAPPWQGESVAIERFFEEINLKQPVLKKFPFSIHPSGYFIK